MVWFIILYKVVPYVASVDGIPRMISRQMKATEYLFFIVVLFIMLYKVVLSFESMDEILK